MDRAVEINPASADAHLLKGWYSFHQDQVADALKQVRLAIELDPDYAKSWLALGLFQLKTGESLDAIHALRKTLELYPGCPERVAIQDILSQVYAQLHADASAAQ